VEEAGDVHAPQPRVPSLEFEREADAPLAPSPSAPAPSPPFSATAAAPGTSPLDDQQLETLIVEAEVFAKYGLTDKAIDRLFSLVRRRPDLLKARERLVELLAESGNPALRRETQGLADAYNAAGREDDARRVLADVRLSVEAEP